MSPKTDAEVEAEIVSLKSMKPKVRRYTAFGEDNRDAIQAQIDVLEQKISGGKIYDRFGDDEYLHGQALTASAWRSGENAEDGSPSEQWAPLVQE